MEHRDHERNLQSRCEQTETPDVLTAAESQEEDDFCLLGGGAEHAGFNNQAHESLWRGHFIWANMLWFVFCQRNQSSSVFCFFLHFGVKTIERIVE